MKKSVALLGLIFLAGTAFAEMDHSKMHDMMMKQGGMPGPDTRTELTMPEPMKRMQKTMMRQHLATIGEITSALASNDLGRAAAAAKGLGWSPMEEQRCEMMGEISGAKDFASLGKAVHTKADEVADFAAKGDRDKALASLSQLIKNCNACHEKYRH